MAISSAKQAFLDALAGVKQKIDTGDDTFAETEMTAVTNLVNEKVAGVTAGLTTQVAELVTKVAELTANDADTDELAAPGKFEAERFASTAQECLLNR